MQIQPAADKMSRSVEGWKSDIWSIYGKSGQAPGSLIVTDVNPLFLAKNYPRLSLVNLKGMRWNHLSQLLITLNEELKELIN